MIKRISRTQIGVTSIDLFKEKRRIPQGFSFHLDSSDPVKNLWFTSNIMIAYLFYLEYGIAEPELVEVFETIRQKEDYLYSLSFAVNSQETFPSPDGMDYTDYQRAGIEYILNTQHTLLTSDPRIGKTVISLGVFNVIKPNKAIIVCPKTVKLGWYREAKKWLIGDYKIQVLSAGDSIDELANIYIINYDILHMFPQLSKINCDIIVGDELHIVKNLETKRSKFFYALKGKKRLGLTGTPILTSPNDLLTILKWVDEFWNPFTIFRGQFATKSGISWDLDFVQERIRKTCMVRLEQAQIFNVEPIETRMIPLEINDQIRETMNEDLTKIQNYATARRNLGLHKVNPTLNHVKTFSTEGEKIVIFAYHKDVIARLQAGLGASAVSLNSETSSEERMEAIRRFQEDDTCQYFIGSIIAASMGIDLSVSNHIVFAEYDWTAGLVEQARQRCSNKDQKRQVYVDCLYFPGDKDEQHIETRMYDKVESKYKMEDKAINILYE